MSAELSPVADEGSPAAQQMVAAMSNNVSGSLDVWNNQTRVSHRVQD